MWSQVQDYCWNFVCAIPQFHTHKQSIRKSITWHRKRFAKIWQKKNVKQHNRNTRLLSEQTCKEGKPYKTGRSSLRNLPPPYIVAKTARSRLLLLLRLPPLLQISLRFLKHVSKIIWNRHQGIFRATKRTPETAKTVHRNKIRYRRKN